MELNFGHGFIPRIGEDNYKAVDLCVGPPDLFSSETLELPWAIVDGPWAESHPHLLDVLRANGTRMLFDTMAWRYRFDRSFEMPKLAGASWSAAGPVNPAMRSDLRTLAQDSLEAQARLEASAYLVPGLIPATRDEDLRAAYEPMFEAAAAVSEPKPLVQFVGGHSQGLDPLRRLLDSVPHYISGVYLQLSPLRPVRDSPAKLEAALAAFRHARELGFVVIAGHGGGIAPLLRALGVDAADAGLGLGESFDQGTARRTPSAVEREPGEKTGGRQSRCYLPSLGRSFGSVDVKRMLEVPGAAAQILGCRLACHRFRPDDYLATAREHSLRARIQDVQDVCSMPAGMRLTTVYERLRNQRSALSVVNGALEHAGQDPIDMRPVDNHLAWLTRAHSEVA